jgi:teichuronic acid biosynthesis glycosyltransferase TuaG
VPRVSVIIPAHNAAEHLPETIASVEAQTYRDWEIVACDDGSTDNTFEVLSDGGPLVRAVRNDRAEGPASARNHALRHATGEFAVFLDADDLLLPAYLETQLAVYQRESRRGGNVGFVTPDARFLIGDEFAAYTYLDLLSDRQAPITLERVLRRNMVYGACLVPWPVGEAVGWFDHDLFGTEDYGLWIKILEQGYRGVRNPQPVAVYRRVAGSVSSNIASQGLNNRRAYELALARGNLTRAQARIARRGLRYNRAMEEIALLRFSDRRGLGAVARFARVLPMLVSVALRNMRMWPEWWRLLRTGRSPDTAELRAHK